MIEFFSQGGYGAYIWGSFGLALVLLIGEVTQLRREHRTILARVGRLMRMRTRRDNQ